VLSLFRLQHGKLLLAALHLADDVAGGGLVAARQRLVRLAIRAGDLRLGRLDVAA